MSLTSSAELSVSVNPDGYTLATTERTVRTEFDEPRLISNFTFLEVHPEPSAASAVVTALHPQEYRPPQPDELYENTEDGRKNISYWVKYEGSDVPRETHEWVRHDRSTSLPPSTHLVPTTFGQSVRERTVSEHFGLRLDVVSPADAPWVQHYEFSNAHAGRPIPNPTNSNAERATAAGRSAVQAASNFFGVGVIGESELAHLAVANFEHLFHERFRSVFGMSYADLINRDGVDRSTKQSVENWINGYEKGVLEQASEPGTPLAYGSAMIRKVRELKDSFVCSGA